MKSMRLKNSLRVLPIMLLLHAILFNLYGQSPTSTWTGTAKQDAITYTYIININNVTRDSIFGTTISRSNEFYSETKFRGVIKANDYLINEIELLKTNYKGTGSVCLMKLNLKRNNGKLQGSFTSSNKDIKDCGSGTISLILSKEKQTSQSPKEATKTITPQQPSPKKEIEVVRSNEKKNIEQSIAAPTQINNQRKIEKREIDLLNTFRFTEDSVMIKIYDNGVIDGDIISLIINGNIVFDKVKLTTTPLTYVLKSNNTNQFQIECYADNLGEIPPNTGLISISSATKTNEVLFSSDLKKSAAIQVVLKNLR
jgi:hypothetical protein